jgi:hypothetical protein
VISGAKDYQKAGLSFLTLISTLAICVGISETRYADFQSAQSAYQSKIFNATNDTSSKDLLISAHSAWAARPFDSKTRAALTSLAITVDLDQIAASELRQYALPSALMAANRIRPASIESLLQVLIAVIQAEQNGPPSAPLLELAKRELLAHKKSRTASKIRPGFIEYVGARIASAERKSAIASDLLLQATLLAPENPIYAIWYARSLIQNGQNENAGKLVRQHIDKLKQTRLNQPLLERYVQTRVRHHLESLLR